MRIALLAASGLLPILGLSPGQEKLSETLLKELKSAVLLIRDADPNGAFVTTAVVVRKDGPSAFAIAAWPSNVTLNRGDFEAVLHSGDAKREVVIPAKLVTQTWPHNLTIFKLPSKSLPKTVDLSKAAPLRETLPVFKIDFPFDIGRFTQKSRPSLGVYAGTISGLRKDDAGRLVAVQLDIDTTACAGGPVFDSKGGLAGVSFGALPGTRIEFLCPPRDMEAAFRGRIDGYELAERQNSDGKILYEARAVVADPLEVVQSAVLCLAPRSRATLPPKPDATGAWGPAAPDMARHDLNRSEEGWKGTATVSGDVKEDIDYIAQVQWTRKDGSKGWTAPFIFIAEFQLGDPARRRTREEWLGAGSPAAPAPGTAPPPSEGRPTPIASGEGLAGTTTREPGVTITRLRHNPSWMVRQSQFSADGNWLYLLDSVGILRKISVPGFVEDRKLVVGGACTWFERSRDGLLVHVPERQEVWLIDEASLEVRKQVGVGVLSYVTASPGTALAFGYGAKTDLTVIDLAAGSVVNRIPARQFTNESSPRTQRHSRALFLTQWNSVRASSDGKYLFAYGGCLHRFRVEGKDLVCEEIGPPLGLGGGYDVRNPQFIVLSPDSKTVAIQDASREKLDGIPPLPQRMGSYLFGTSDLRKARAAAPTWIVSVHDGAGPVLGIEPRTNRVQQLEASGALVRELSLNAGMQSHLFHAGRHPSGKMFVAIVNQDLLWLEFEP